MTNSTNREDMQCPKRSLLANVLADIDEADTSYLARSLIASKVHSERFARKGLTHQAYSVREQYKTDFEAFGISPRKIDARIKEGMNYEQIRSAIVGYILELQESKGLQKTLKGE